MQFTRSSLSFSFSSFIQKRVHRPFYHQLVSFSKQWILNKRLQFRYPDMTIYTSRGSMMILLNSLIQPCMFTVISNNVGITHGLIKLGNGANRIMTTGNNGGSSEYSEALSIELFNRLVGLNLVKTETEMKVAEGPLLDYAAMYNNALTVGVSVTRAVAFNRPYTKYDADKLLKRKLNAMVKANQGIQIDKYILHIWTQSGKTASIVKRITRKYAKDYKDVIVLISIVNTDSIFFNKYPLRS